MLVISFIFSVRPGEICGLKWQNIFNDHIRIIEGLDKKKRTTNLKNSSSLRGISFTEDIYTLFKIEKTWQKKNKVLLGPRYHNSDYVFTHEYGTAITLYRYNITFKKLQSLPNFKELNFSDIPIYKARHTFGTNTIASGIKLENISTIMGHTSLNTTIQNYVVIKEEPIKQAIDQMTKIYDIK